MNQVNKDNLEKLKDQRREKFLREHPDYRPFDSRKEKRRLAAAERRAKRQDMIKNVLKLKYISMLSINEIAAVYSVKPYIIASITAIHGKEFRKESKQMMNGLINNGTEEKILSTR